MPGLHPLRLNLGCGATYRPGYVNVDSSPDGVADVRADAVLLPFRPSTFRRIEMIHLVEHLGYADALLALAESFRVLAPGGGLVIETPDPEASFRWFLDHEDQESRAGLLSWIFGMDRPGYGHRLLYPAGLIGPMLQRAGFTRPRVEPARHHLYAPGLRVTAEKDGLPVHNVLSDLRRWTRVTGKVDLSRPREALEFERTFIDNVLALGGGANPAPDPVEAALQNVLVAPDTAARWVDLCAAFGVEMPLDQARLARVARAAAEQRLAARMSALFNRLGAEDEEAGRDGWETLREQGLSALRRAWEGAPGSEAAALRALLPEPTGGHDRRPVTRAAFEDRVMDMHDRAVRLICRGREQEALDLFVRAARPRVLPLYPLWNLAVAHAANGRLEECVTWYREALKWAPPETAPVIAGELAAALIHAGRSDEAAEVARGLPPGRDRDALLHAAHGGDAPPPPLRTRPVVSGESYHHEPDTA